MTNAVTFAKHSTPVPVKRAALAGVRGWGLLTAGSRRLPDFLVIGTKRGGTTSLWNYLIAHPEVAPLFPAAQNLKSPHYFYWHYDKGERWYRSHFERGLGQVPAAGRLAGEASPYYLYYPRAAERIHELLPTVKIIVLLRDPVARAYSHYCERVNEGVEKLSFEAALAAEPERLEGELDRMSANPFYYSRPHDYYTYRDRGRYHPQLSRWFAQFPREQFCILGSERFYANPGVVYDRVTDFLGLSRHVLSTPKRHNYRPAPVMAAATRAELTEYYRQPNRDVFALLNEDFGWPT